jgi:hypothetical protein
LWCGLRWKRSPPKWRGAEASIFASTCCRRAVGQEAAARYARAFTDQRFLRVPRAVARRPATLDAAAAAHILVWKTNSAAAAPMWKQASGRWRRLEALGAERRLPAHLCSASRPLLAELRIVAPFALPCEVTQPGA